MRIYMAGGITGNLRPYWTRVARGGIPDKELSEFISAPTTDEMKIYLAGLNDKNGIIKATAKGRAEEYINYSTLPPTNENKSETQETIKAWKPYILESFYYADKEEMERLMPYFGDFLLDSGAFTFMQNAKKAVNWGEYLDGYIDFINDLKVDKYFELDIDSIVGYENVLKLRRALEARTGKQSIPVWHLSRGKEEFLRMCDEYDYVAIGGIVSGEVKRSYYKYFPWLISEAHKRNAKIHGLGFTNLEGLKQYHFDSVDSTAWTTGNRFGHAYKFNGKTIVKIDKPQGHKAGNPRKLAVNNFIEWCKFQKYAEEHL